VSRYKFSRSCEPIPGYKFGGGHWRSVAVQTNSEAVIYHGAEFKLRAVARSGFIPSYIAVLSAEAKAKTVTNNLPILSVLALGII